MRNFIIGRIGQMLLTFLVIITVLFFLFRLGLPDPTLALISDGLSAEDRGIVMERFGLDKPLWQQYFIYLANIAHGELGTSLHYKAPVFGIAMEKFGNTMVLMVAAILLSYTIGPSACCFRGDVAPDWKC